MKMKMQGYKEDIIPFKFLVTKNIYNIFKSFSHSKYASKSFLMMQMQDLSDIDWMKVTLPII